MHAVEQDRAEVVRVRENWLDGQIDPDPGDGVYR